MKYSSLTGIKKYIVGKKKSDYKKSIKDNKMLNKLYYGTSVKTEESYKAIDIFKDSMNNHNNCCSNSKAIIHNSYLVNLFSKRVNLYLDKIYRLIINYLINKILIKKKLFKQLLLIAFKT